MGTDKALVPFRGRPLVEHALEILRGAGLTASIAGARSPLEAFAAVQEDAEPDKGPLGGVCAALRSTTAEQAVFIPVDAPLLPSSLISYMVRHAETTGAAVTLVRVGGFTQTFPTVLRRAVSPWLERELAEGHLGCLQAFEGAAASLGQHVSVIGVEDAAAAGSIAHPERLAVDRWFANLNSPVDLRDASK
jgi:molybdopterin-guanine dinucleotide biosynthesis protein A